MGQEWADPRKLKYVHTFRAFLSAVRAVGVPADALIAATRKSASHQADRAPHLPRSRAGHHDRVRRRIPRVR